MIKLSKRMQTTQSILYRIEHFLCVSSQQINYSKKNQVATDLEEDQASELDSVLCRGGAARS